MGNQRARNRAERRRAGQIRGGGRYAPRTSPRPPARRHSMAMPLNSYGELVRGRRTTGPAAARG